LTLPPYANLLAVRDEDPGRQADVKRRLERLDGMEVRSAAGGWLVASEALPFSGPEPPAVLEAGLAFAEGRDRVLGAGAGPHSRAPDSVAELATAHPERLAELPGDFTFFAFAASGAVTAVRSAGGLVPVYVDVRAPGRLALATRLDLLVRHMAAPTRLDGLPNAVQLTGIGGFPDGRSYVQGISILPRGGYERREPYGKAVGGRYWDPRPSRAQDVRPSPEHPQRLRELLIGTLERELDPARPNLLTLSGGADSSSLAALAAGRLGRPTATWTILPDDEVARRAELPFLENLWARYRFEPRWEGRMDFTRVADWISELRGVAVQVQHRALCELPRMHAEVPLSVMFGGEYGDQVCGSALRLADWAALTPARALLRKETGRPLGKRDPQRWLKLRLRPLSGRTARFPDELPGWVRPDVREEYREWLDRRGRAALRDKRPMRGLALLGDADSFVSTNWEVASALGIRRCFPFHNREVLELAFQCHPRELIGPGPKKLLRNALADDVPAANLYREQKWFGPHSGTAPVPWERAIGPRLETVLRGDWLSHPPAAMPWIDAMRLAALCELERRVDGLLASP
jgi:hypothetical protein